MTKKLNNIKINKNCAAINKMHTKNNIDAKPKKVNVKEKRSYAKLPDQLIYNYYWQDNNK